MKRLLRAAAAVSLVTGLAAFAVPGAANAAEAPAPPAAAIAAAVVPADGTVQTKVAALLDKSDLPQDLKDRITATVAKLPSDFDATVARTRDRFGLSGTGFDDIAKGAIDGGQYACGTTPLTDWVDGQMSRANIVNLLLLQLVGGLDAPTYDALLFGKAEGASFGYDGGYTNELTTEVKKLKSFWDFDGSDIQLVPMHGAKTFSDLGHLTEVYEAMYGAPAGIAGAMAGLAQSIVQADPGMEGGDNPLFSFNAFSFKPDASTEAQFPDLTRRIIVGDGVLKGQHEIGLSDQVAPQAVVAHEYGHQVQYADNLDTDTDLTGPEATRRLELMADAYGTYFMVHSLGNALNAQRTLVDEKTFYNVGDCSFTSEGHHGTPNQRARSSAWAASVVDSAPNQGHQLGGVAFDTLFEKELPTLVAPDAGN